MGRIPEAKQMELLNHLWRPKWPWQPRFVMFTSYWPDPNFFIVYGTDGTSTFALRGMWSDLKYLLALMSPRAVTYLRLTKYPGEDVEAIQPGVDRPEGFLPVSMSSNPSDVGGEIASTPGPISASLCITVPHWTAVARAFERMLREGQPASPVS